MSMMEDPFFAKQRELFELMLERGKKIEQECVEFPGGCIVHKGSIEKSE